MLYEGGSYVVIDEFVVAFKRAMEVLRYSINSLSQYLLVLICLMWAMSIQCVYIEVRIMTRLFHIFKCFVHLFRPNV